MRNIASSLGLAGSFLFCMVATGPAHSQADEPSLKINPLVKAIDPQCEKLERGETLDQRMAKLRRIESCIREKQLAPAAKAGAPAIDPNLLMDAEEEVEAEAAATQNQKQFLGFNWGVGLGFSMASGSRVEEAQAVGGIVRPVKDTSEQARVFLEYHWFPEAWTSVFARKDDRIVRAHGPFIAAATRDDKLLSGAGVGWMIGFRDEAASEGFAVAIGIMMDNDVKSLAKGFKENQPLPAGETEIRYREQSETSGVLFFTRTF
jgi:hypothetical protein